MNKNDLVSDQPLRVMKIPAWPLDSRPDDLKVKIKKTMEKSNINMKQKGGAGKTTYTFTANANVLSANFPFSVLPAGGEGGSGGGNGKYVGVSGIVYVNLPTPNKRACNINCPRRSKDILCTVLYYLKVSRHSLIVGKMDMFYVN
jgi:hypothetical protein